MRTQVCIIGGGPVGSAASASFCTVSASHTVGLKRKLACLLCCRRIRAGVLETGLC